MSGNKRTGLAAPHTFARTNRFALAGTQDEQVEFVLSIARGELSIEEVAAWVREHLRRP